VLAAAVSSGNATPMDAWPEFFPGDEGDGSAFPGRDTDMAAFKMEHATPASFAADMAALVNSSKRVVLREQEPPPAPRTGPEPEHVYVPDPEWT
jgi:hypothetical protein